MSESLSKCEFCGGFSAGERFCVECLCAHAGGACESLPGSCGVCAELVACSRCGGLVPVSSVRDLTRPGFDPCLVLECIECGEESLVGCRDCGWSSSDPLTADVVNEQTGVCPECQSKNLVFRVDGESFPAGVELCSKCEREFPVDELMDWRDEGDPRVTEFICRECFAERSV